MAAEMAAEAVTEAAAETAVEAVAETVAEAVAETAAEAVAETVVAVGVVPRVSPVETVAVAMVDAETADPRTSSSPLVPVHFYRSPDTLSVSGSVWGCV